MKHICDTCKAVFVEDDGMGPGVSHGKCHYCAWKQYQELLVDPEPWAVLSVVSVYDSPHGVRIYASPRLAPMLEMRGVLLARNGAKIITSFDYVIRYQGENGNRTVLAIETPKVTYGRPWGAVKGDMFDTRGWTLIRPILHAAGDWIHQDAIPQKTRRVDA